MLDDGAKWIWNLADEPFPMLFKTALSPEGVRDKRGPFRLLAGEHRVFFEISFERDSYRIFRLSHRQCRARSTQSRSREQQPRRLRREMSLREVRERTSMLDESGTQGPSRVPRYGSGGLLKLLDAMFAQDLHDVLLEPLFVV